MTSPRHPDGDLAPRDGRVNEVITNPWRATIADDRLRRVFTANDFDDHAWSPAEVPGHWREIPDLADADGPVLYRTSFDTASDDYQARSDRRHWLTFDGIHYASDIWLDGEYLGTTEGYFAPHTFEITEQVDKRDDHVLALEVLSSSAGTPGATRDLRGVFNDPDVVGATWNAGGIWRDVRVESTGPVRLTNLRTTCVSADAESATIELNATLASAELQAIEAVTTIRHPGGDESVHRSTHHLASGDTKVQWPVVIPEPELWWPSAFGDQPMYEVTVDIAVEGSTTVSDSCSRHLGLRTVAFDDYQLQINGERLFCQGVVVWPTGRALGSVTHDQIGHDLDLIEQLGLNMVRLHTHVARPEFYEECDRRGLLIWQDLPLRGRAAKSLENPAPRQAEQLVDLLAHHPSVVVWCGHDDPTDSSKIRRNASLKDRARRLGFQEAPTWNKTVLDRAIARTFARTDPTRPVIAHSGVLPGPAHPAGTDSHLWFGWGTGSGREFADFARRFRQRVRWVSAFGAQSVPTSNEFCEPHRWPDLNWSNLAGEWGLDLATMRAYQNPDEHVQFERWVEATQSYQATILRRQIEELRRRKYQPTGGFTFMAFADARPAISFSILDDERKPKEAFGAVRDACRPLIVVADRMSTRLLPGESVALAIDVVNDRREQLTDHRVDAELTWPGSSHAWQFRANIEADTARQVGMITWMVPPNRGAVRLVLRLVDTTSETIVATNTYTAAIT